jgi:hypothetical protein
MIKNAKESHIRKAKGEKLQKEIVADLKKHFPDHADNIKSTPMSAHGEDIQMTDEARKDIPFSFEAKYKEKGFSNVYSAYEQCQSQTANLATTDYIYSVAFLQQRGHVPLVVLSADDFFRLMPKLTSDTANDNGGNER